MADHDLLFELPPSSSGHLLFGENAPVFTAEATVSISFPAFACDVRVVPSVAADLVVGFPPARLVAVAVPTTIARLNVSFPPLAMGGTLAYASRTARPTVGSTDTAWQKALQHKSWAAAGMQRTRSWPVGTQTRYAAAQAERGWGVSGFVGALATANDCRSHHQSAVPAGSPGVTTYQEAVRIPRQRSTRYQEGDACRNSRMSRHQDGIRTIRERNCSRYQAALRGAVAGLQAHGGKALTANQSWRTHVQIAMVPPPGIHSVGPTDPVVPPVDTRCYHPNAHLLFAMTPAADAHLLFLCDNRPDVPPGKTPVVVAVRKVYVVINNVSLHRLPDGAEIPTLSLSLSLDAASWAWGFDASLPGMAEALVAPGNADTPVELVASINGTDFRLLAENISRERSFGATSIRVSGRGRNAVLAAPYAPVMSFSQTEARTARQLMDDVLTINGISLGWTIDWGLTDWNVPAGVFTRQGSWIEALNAIAEAAGGYLLPHPTDKRIRVRHRYPVVPWEWSTVIPDFVLPVDAVSRESIRWLEKPGYNRVFVSGQDVGVVGRVTRTGTAGEVLAPMVVDPLITEAQAARQRGIAVLSDTGKQIEVSLRLPVLAETGIIEPGAFVEYQEGSMTKLGLVRSTRVEVGLPEVWQTLGVEAHA